MNLGKKTLRSTGWSTAGMVVNQVLNLVRLAILARLLEPADFGLYAMALVVFTFVQTFGNMGTTAALIQRKEHTPTLTSTLFYVNVLMGICLAVVFYFSAPYVASLYGESRVTGLLQLLAVVFFIASTGFVHSAMLRRELEFAAIVKADVIANFLSTLVCIYLALQGFKAFSFVYQMLIFTVLNVLLLFWYLRWIPRLAFRVSDVRSVFSFSANLTLFGFIDYIALNVDKFLIGKFMGTEALGIYYMGYRVILLPIRQVTNSIKNVLFSSLAKVQDDNEKFRKVFLKVVFIISFFTAPLMLTFIAVADLLTLVVFGQKWSGAVAILMIFAPLGMVMSIVTPTSIIYLVKDKTRMLLNYGVLNAVVLTIGVAIGLQGSAITVAALFVICSIAVLVPVVNTALSYIGLTMREFLKEIAPTFVKAVTVALFAWLLKRFVLEGLDWTPLAKLLILAGCAASLYLAVSYKSVIREYHYLRQYT